MYTMDNIVIMDDFLDESEIKLLLDIVNRKKGYTFGHTSGERESIVNKFFSVINTEQFFLENILHKIERIHNKTFKINRHYMHIQTYGLDGGYHTDDTGENKYTFCIYFHTVDLSVDQSPETLGEKIGGEFFIKIPNQKEILCIEPVFNRGIFFPSFYLHKGMAFNRLYPQYRLCITWKLELL